MKFTKSLPFFLGPCFGIYCSDFATNCNTSDPAVLFCTNFKSCSGGHALNQEIALIFNQGRNLLIFKDSKP